MEKIDILGLSLRGEKNERFKSVLNIKNKSPNSRKQELKNSNNKN